MTDPNPVQDEMTIEFDGDGGVSDAGGGGGMMHQDEDVLREVLDELDRERTRRAELEAQVRSRTEENQSLTTQLAEREELTKRLQAENDELKSTISALENAPPTPVKANPDPVAVEKEVTRHAFMAMETQVKEYQLLIDALTLGKPAIALAAKQTTTPGQQQQNPWGLKPKNNKTLPLHVVRLLEILPWTPHAYEHCFAKEEIFEWQFYDSREKQWTSNLRIFPQYFKALPMVRPKAGKDQTILGPGNTDASDGGKPDGRGLLVFLAGGAGAKPNGGVNHHSPSKHGVLTNEEMTHLLSIENGYPLPEDGGIWEWIGGWRIEKRVTASQQPSSGTAAASSPSSPRQRVDCDEQGWSYAKEAEHFKVNPAELCWDTPGEAADDDNASISSRNNNNNSERSQQQQSYTRCIRRRKWTRQRVLVEYPQASDFTKEYLKLLAENARLTVTTNKISDQLVETKTTLTENEETLMNEKSEAAATIARMTEELTQLRKIAGHAVTDGGDGSPMNNNNNQSNPLQEFLQKNEQQVKGLGSKFQQWVASRGRADSKDAGNRSRSNSTDLLTSTSNNNSKAGQDEAKTPAETPSTGSPAEQPTDGGTIAAIDTDVSSSDPKTTQPDSSGGQGGFDWSKVTRGGLFQKLNRKDGNDREPESNDNADKTEGQQNKSADILKLGEAARNTEGSSSTDDEHSVEDEMRQEETLQA